MDKFHEQLLTTSKNASYKTLNFLMYFSFVFAFFYLALAILSFNTIYFISSIVVLCLSFLFRFLRNKSYREFEYIFTNGNLQIDVIYNKQKRKTIIDEDVKNFDSFGKKQDVKLSNNVELINCIPYDYKGEVYALALSGGRRVVYISPDDELLKLINLYYLRRR